MSRNEHFFATLNLGHDHVFPVRNHALSRGGERFGGRKQRGVDQVVPVHAKGRWNQNEMTNSRTERMMRRAWQHKRVGIERILNFLSAMACVSRLCVMMRQKADCGLGCVEVQRWQEQGSSKTFTCGRCQESARRSFRYPEGECRSCGATPTPGLYRTCLRFLACPAPGGRRSGAR